MTLQNYIELLKDLLNSTPDAKDMKVITSSDDEGNSYNAVHYAPGIMVVENADAHNIELIGEVSEVDEGIGTKVVCLN
jgi:hypothetical protein